MPSYAQPLDEVYWIVWALVKTSGHGRPGGELDVSSENVASR